MSDSPEVSVRLMNFFEETVSGRQSAFMSIQYDYPMMSAVAAPVADKVLKQHLFRLKESRKHSENGYSVVDLGRVLDVPSSPGTTPTA